MSSSNQRQRLVEALQLVKTAMHSPNAFENSKESTFSALRRGCLDLRRTIEQLESHEFSWELIQDAWLFLIELSKAKLRRKHALECIHIMLLSPKWTSVLRTSDAINEKVSTMSGDMQAALGFEQTGESPTTSPAAPPILLVSRKASAPLQTASVTKSKSKVRRGTSSGKVDREISTPAESDAMVTCIPPPPAVDPLPSSSAHLSRTYASHELNESNPFRMDFNPFKEFRGQGLRSNPHARRARGDTWWDDTFKNSQPVYSLQPPWW